MPVDLDQRVIKRPYINRQHEAPLTEFVPLTEAAKVEIQGVSIPPNLVEFVSACHKSVATAEDKYDNDEILEMITKGQTLWQCLEAIRFHVKISDASRVFTHQLVRARVGVTFSQQCTGDVDSRHTSIVIPGFIGFEDYSDFMEHCVAAKAKYAEIVDCRSYTIQEARYILPMGLTSFIYMDICLGALVELYKKRSCTQTQTWEMIVFCQHLKAEIAKVAPWVLPMLKGCAEGGDCWWKKAKTCDLCNTNLWPPDKNHDFPYHPSSYDSVHTHEQLSGRVPRVGLDTLWIGEAPVTRETFNEYKKKYRI
jgi:thymidylate synthase ThyX